MKPVFTLTLAELATKTGATLEGDGSRQIVGIAPLQNADSNQVSLLTNPRFRKYLLATRAAAVILHTDDNNACSVATLRSTHPELVYARAAQLFAPQTHLQTGIHPSASVGPSCQIADDAWIGPHCFIEAEVSIGSGAIIGPHCTISRGVSLGQDSCLTANVTICHDVRIGKRALIHPGTVIGSDGFGFTNDKGRWLKIAQLGSVIIGDDVEIGANTTIDRGALGDTVIGDGVKLDNQIQIAHNVHIGDHTAIAGCVGIAGSVLIGRHCRIGGGVGIAGHLEIADHVHITGMSLVTKSIFKSGIYSSGLPVLPNRLWNKISARLRRLDDLARQVKSLEKSCHRGTP